MMHWFIHSRIFVIVVLVLAVVFLDKIENGLLCIGTVLFYVTDY